MSLDQVKEIANAVLYEGYLLYPYRQSAIKNRQRWTIGVVYPREYSDSNGGVEPWQMQSECLVIGNGGATLDVHVRFLHLLLRTVEQPKSADSAACDDQQGYDWSLASRFADEPREEGVERELRGRQLKIGALLERPRLLEFSFPAERLVEPDESLAGRVVREHQRLEGSVCISAIALGSNLFKLTVVIENTTPETATVSPLRNIIMRHSLISTHTILEVQDGVFASLLEPPEDVAEAVKQCVNKNTWPVLVGNEGDRDVMLSSPIILYDYPQIAPESPGSLFDGTEIDEILTLRILTLTDEEKAEIRQGDPRVREILDRAEQLTPEDFMKLHGTIRSMKPVAEEEPQ